MANEGHNVGDLNKAIRECATQMGEINTERKELNERAGDIRERLRKLGVETKAFDFAVRLQGMEQEARANYLDSLRINFDALSIGAQSEMFQEAANVAGNGEDKAAKAKKAAKPKAKKAAKVSRGVKAEGATA